MKYNFCTLFDSYYLTRGIALYKSLESHCEVFHLYIFAFDDISYTTLKKLKLNHTTIISLKEFENEDLLRVKPTRTFAEYCWTSTATAIWFSIKNYNLDHCTYLDADILFFASPIPIFEEIGNKSIGITPHNFSSNVKSTEIYGKYCVQFTYFKNDNYGMKALEWWKNSSIEWCYAKLEDGKYGDQKYLDYFEEKFDNVHIINHNGAGVAPWNVSLFNIKSNGSSLSIETKKQPINTFELIFYHFQGLKFEKSNNSIVVYPSFLKISAPILRFIYKPYVLMLLSIKKEITINYKIVDNIKFKRKKISILTRFIKEFLKRFPKIINLYYRLPKKRRYNRPEGIEA